MDNKGANVQKLQGIRDDVKNLKPFKGRADLLNRIENCYRVVQTHKTDRKLEALLIRECKKLRSRAVEMHQEKYPPKED